MKITKVQIYDVIPVNRSKGWPAKQNPVIIRVVTDEGIYGAGEISLTYGSAAKAAVGILRDYASEYLIGADPARIEFMWEGLYRRTFWGQGGGPVIYGGISAIDEALWDIKGKMLGVPVYELMGGKMRDRIHLYANGWYIDRTLIQPEEYAEAALRVVADGYDALKFDPLMVTPEGEWQWVRRTIDNPKRFRLAVERVRAVREAVGPDVDILIEMHGNLGVTDAILLGKEFEAFKPLFYEEPVDPMNVECMKKVSENVNIPIASGERLYTRYGFREFIEKQALNILQPDIGLTGGLTEVKKIASYAETYNLHVQPHNCGGPVSAAVGLQFDACTPNFIIQEWFPYWADDRYEIVTEAPDLQAQGSYSEIPAKPGLGIELNDDYLRRHTCIEIP
ncbi:MAG: mandelate racemase/muconate lactonizing enzyme family protein [Dehalococcoidia bacterium]|nr:mandelate racemase/muconate lactonizing enzyme family protein [Dehalococcoidia bacterium]